LGMEEKAVNDQQEWLKRNNFSDKVHQTLISKVIHTCSVTPYLWYINARTLWDKREQAECINLEQAK